MSRAQDLTKQINRLLGADTLQLANDARFIVSYTPTGLLPFDVLLQGGLPRGRFVVLTGSASTLKSYVGLHAIAQAQQAGGVAALIDTEHAFDPHWARTVGVDERNLLVEHPETGELAVDVAELLIRNSVDLIVFDSVAATLPQQEQAKRMHKEHIQPARLAALMSAACRRLTAANHRTAVLWINQLREQVGVTFGPTERPTGGRALSYYASIIVNVRQAGRLTRDTRAFTGDKYVAVKEQIGQTYRAVVEKSKLNRPWREVFFDFNLEDPVGVDEVKFLFTHGVELGLVTQKGNTWRFDTITAVGKARFLDLLRGNACRHDLDAAIRRHYDLPPRPGRSAARKTSAARSNATSSTGLAREGIPVAARAGSPSTGRPPAKLSKSRAR